MRKVFFWQALFSALFGAWSVGCGAAVNLANPPDVRVTTTCTSQASDVAKARCSMLQGLAVGFLLGSYAEPEKLAAMTCGEFNGRVDQYSCRLTKDASAPTEKCGAQSRSVTVGFTKADPGAMSTPTIISDSGYFDSCK